MTARIKIVPDAKPDADGEWVETDLNLTGIRRWRLLEEMVAPFVPKGHHIVAIERDAGLTVKG